jgi:hypothetical protein
MPRASGGLWLIPFLLIAGGVVVHGDDSSKPAHPGARDEDTEELKQRLLEGDHDEAVSAAIELFTSGRPRYDGKQDAFLEGVLHEMQPRDGGGRASARARRCVLEGVGLFGRYRVPVACRLARIGIGDGEPEVRAAAANALAGIEQPDVYHFLADELKALAKSPPGSPEARDLDTLLGVVERKRDPIVATGVLVEALPFFENVEESKLRASLKRLTGRTFEGADDWKRWYEEHKATPQREWYLEALKASDDQAEKASAAAVQIFEKLIASILIRRDEAALLQALEEALSKETLPAVRAAAIRHLGGLGARPGTAGDRATGLLENLLKQAPKDADEATIRAALMGLGLTARPGELVIILPYTDHSSRPVRLAAIAALGALRAEGSVAPLVKTLSLLPPLEARDPDAAASCARALGIVGKDPEGKSSSCLLGFVERVAGLEPAAARPPLLQAAAEALGGLGPALAPDGDVAAAIVSTLAALAEPAQHQDVRWWATTSLGRIPHARALDVLALRVHDDTLNVRRAAIGAIGLQSRRPGATDALVRQGIQLLATEVAGTDDALKRAARAELDEVVSHDTATFIALDALVDALSRRGAPDLAGPFLEGLPPQDKLAPDPRPGAAEAQKKRWWSLLEARAAARLRLQDGRGAAADYEVLLTSPQASGQRQHVYMLGRARALLAAGDHKLAADRAAELARLDPKDDAAWACLKQAAEALLGRGERAVVKELLASVDRVLQQASTEVQAGFQETLKRVDLAPNKSGDSPGKRENP